MLKFNKSIGDVIDTQPSASKVGQFKEFASKKSILATELLTDTHKEYIAQLRGTFAFALHNSGKYLVITLFNSANRKYRHLIMELDTLRCAEVDSIRTAKSEVLALVNNVDVEDVEEITDEEPVEEIVEEVDEELIEKLQDVVTDLKKKYK